MQYYFDGADRVELPDMKAFDFIYSKNKEYLEQTAIEFMGVDITYEKFFSEIERVAKALKEIGVNAGDIVTLALATAPETAYLLYAINRIGATVNALDPRYSYEEFKEKIIQTDSKFFFGINMSTSKIYQHKDELGIKEIVELSPVDSSNSVVTKMLISLSNKKSTSMKWKEFIKKGDLYSGNIDADYNSSIPAVIVYTGGTTGIPKGVMLSNLNMNMMSYNNEISLDYTQKRGETMLNFLPPFSAYSIVNALHDPLSWGFKTIMIPMFKPTDFPNLMFKHKPNHVLSGPILWEYMMNSKKCEKMDLSFLISPVTGGDSMSEEMEQRVNKYLKDCGCKYRIQQGYGMSEVSAAATYSTEKSYRSGSVGVPYFRNIIAAFDENTDDEKTYFESGEIRISTPTMMLGYYGNPKATQNLIYEDKNGIKWVKTGDYGYVDSDGHVFIQGRLKRLIVRSGNKIFPINIENVIQSIADIDNCAVVGRPDAIEKTVPVAFIVLKENVITSREDIIKNIERKIKSEMESHCVPADYIFKDSLPLTGMAKVDFKLLEKECLKIS